jgi:excisionase family DNA binding protein
MRRTTPDPVALPASEEEQVQALRKLLKREGKARLVGKGGEPMLELPDAVFGLLLQILEDMQQGKAISIVPVTQDQTTQQAAEILGLSRPFLVKLLEDGAIPYHKVGTHRRVYLRDILQYKEQRDRERHRAIRRIAEAAEEAGVYDRVILPDE